LEAVLGIDCELGRVVDIVYVGIIDNLKCIVIGLEFTFINMPLVRASVWNMVSDGEDGKQVGRCSFFQIYRDGSLSGGSPSNLHGLTGSETCG